MLHLEFILQTKPFSPVVKREGEKKQVVHILTDPAYSLSYLDTKHQHLTYHLNRIFPEQERQRLLQRIEQIRAGFEAQVAKGPFNNSWTWLDLQVAGFKAEFDFRHQWHKEIEAARKKAHADTAALKQLEKQLEAATRAFEGEQKRRNERRAKQDKECGEKRLRAMLDQERDVTTLLRPSSMMSGWSWK